MDQGIETQKDRDMAINVEIQKDRYGGIEIYLGNGDRQRLVYRKKMDIYSDMNRDRET